MDSVQLAAEQVLFVHVYNYSVVHIECQLEHQRRSTKEDTCSTEAWTARTRIAVSAPNQFGQVSGNLEIPSSIRGSRIYERPSYTPLSFAEAKSMIPSNLESLNYESTLPNTTEHPSLRSIGTCQLLYHLSKALGDGGALVIPLWYFSPNTGMFRSIGTVD